LIYKKGIGKGFFLSTEQHSIESVDEREQITVQMKNGVKANLSAYFVQSIHEYGPSGFIRIKGELFDQNGKVVKTLNQPAVDIYLNESKTITQEDEKGAEQIELIITPVSL
jgi:predicted MPP superfamily phosphohydrolase